MNNSLVSSKFIILKKEKLITMEENKQKGFDEKFCNDCGSIIKIKAEICPGCGIKQKNSNGTLSKTTAAIIALFLGGLGIHKFYLKRPGTGLLYLFFFWTFIPCLLAFIDFILLLIMDDDKFNEKYNN